MLETFFLISLAITFLLVVFLVYHFKNRISTLEHKCDTMFEIINNVASELGHVRNILQINNTNVPVMSEINNNQERILVSLSDNEQDLTDSDDDDETVSDDDDETDSDSDDETDSDSEVEANSEVEVNNIKLVSVELNGDIDNPIESNEDDTIIDTDNEPVTQIEQSEEPQIIVEKIVDENNHLDESSITSSHSNTKKSVYKKMTLPVLKSLVIEKGLMSDPSKLKKTELIELIESSDI